MLESFSMSETDEEEPTVYLEQHIFPLLLPALEETLQVAKRTERRKLFNPLDYLAAYLYRNNPQHEGREKTVFEEIPFVKEEWAKNPRKPLPLSATLTEVEAAIIVQSHYRGYLTRKQPNVQVFRTWRRHVKSEREAAQKLQKFWRRVSVARKPLDAETISRLETLQSNPEEN